MITGFWLLSGAPVARSFSTTAFLAVCHLFSKALFDFTYTNNSSIISFSSSIGIGDEEFFKSA
jgi:hypothetical protein